MKSLTHLVILGVSLKAAEIKNPTIFITVIFFLTAVLSYIGIFMSASVSDTDPSYIRLGQAFFFLGNVGFWGMVYRVSKHAEFYLQGYKGATFFRIVFVASFVIVFIILFSFTYSQIANKDSYSAPVVDPFAEIAK